MSQVTNPVELVQPKQEVVSRIAEFTREGVNEERFTAPSQNHWQSLREVGTELWLDTGDMDGAEAHWANDITAPRSRFFASLVRERIPRSPERVLR